MAAPSIGVFFLYLLTFNDDDYDDGHHPTIIAPMPVPDARHDSHPSQLRGFFLFIY
jgi:hypothetical protein